MSKGRASLITSVVIGLLAISTAGVSTYAWFQATASATVTASGTSTTITVTKPDEYEFYYYNKNGLANYGSPTGTFNSDFSNVSSSSNTTLTGINPGQAMTFCVKVQNINKARINVTKVISNNDSRQGLAEQRIIYSSTSHINIGWAINVYSTYKLSSNNAYSTFITNRPTDENTGEDKFTCSSADESTYLAGSINNSTKVITLTSAKTIFDVSGLSDATIYIYYTVVFSNHNNNLYNEVDGSGNVVKLPQSSPRKFQQSNSGNSNCFQGLSFALNTLELLRNEQVS